MVWYEVKPNDRSWSTGTRGADRQALEALVVDNEGDEAAGGDYTEGSGNVFADIDVARLEEALAKA